MTPADDLRAGWEFNEHGRRKVDAQVCEEQQKCPHDMVRLPTHTANLIKEEYRLCGAWAFSRPTRAGS